MTSSGSGRYIRTIIDRPVVRATCHCRRSRAISASRSWRAASPSGGVAEGADAVGDAALPGATCSMIVYPALPTAAVSASTVTDDGSNATDAFSVARLTSADRTPSTRLRAFSTLRTHEAQVMPPTSRVTCRGVDSSDTETEVLIGCSWLLGRVGVDSDRHRSRWPLAVRSLSC